MPQEPVVSVKKEEASLLQLAAIIEESHDAIIGATLDGVIVSWNGGAAKMFGYGSHDAIGKLMTDLFLPEMKDALLQLLEKVRLGKAVADYEATWSCKDGTCVDVEFSLSPIHSAQGVIIGVSLVGRNISLRKKAEESMRQAQMIIASSHDAIISETLDAVVTSWNKGAEEMFGYSAQEIIGKSVLVLLPPEQKDEGPVLLEKIRSGEMVVDSDVVRLRKDGTKINVALSISPIRTIDGTLIGASIVERDITMRKKAEQLMRQVQLVVDNSHDAIIGIIGETRNGIITSWNGGATRMFGYSSQEAIGKPMSFLLPDEMKEEASVLLARVVAGETIADYDAVWLRKDNTRINIALSISPVKAEDGTVIGASIVERDITLRKKTEDMMRQTQLIVENSQDAIIGGTADGIITSWNRGAAQVSGYTAQEALGRSFEFLVPLERRDKVALVFKQLIAGETFADSDGSWLRKDGAQVDMSISLSPVTSDDGSVTGVSIVGRNITQRKKIELALRRIEAAVESSKDVICSVSTEGLILSWNKGGELVLGYLTSEIIGKNFMLLIPPEKEEEVKGQFAIVMGGHPIVDDDTSLRRKDGSMVSVGYSVAPMIDQQGVVTGFSAVVRDNTERKKIESRIKELNEMRSKFVAIISHQLGTPLTSVNWNLESVLNGDFGKLDETALKFLQITYKASVEITNRIHDLLSAMDIEEGRVIYKKEDASIDSIAAAVVAGVAQKCERKNLTCQYVVPEKELPPVEVDSEKIRTAITKLVENAIMYTKEGGKVVIKLGASDGMVRFEVEDTGIGIPAPEQHYIFSRFFRASNAAVMQPDSFGLGLFITKSFITQHGGHVGFESKEGKGSTFWFEIPLKAAS